MTGSAARTDSATLTGFSPIVKNNHSLHILQKIRISGMAESATRVQLKPGTHHDVPVPTYFVQKCFRIVLSGRIGRPGRHQESAWAADGSATLLLVLFFTYIPAVLLTVKCEVYLKTLL
jgi:hypothetical protein